MILWSEEQRWVEHGTLTATQNGSEFALNVSQIASGARWVANSVRASEKKRARLKWQRVAWLAETPKVITKILRGFAITTSGGCSNHVIRIMISSLYGYWQDMESEATFNELRFCEKSLFFQAFRIWMTNIIARMRVSNEYLLDYLSVLVLRFWVFVVIICRCLVTVVFWYLNLRCFFHRLTTTLLNNSLQFVKWQQKLVNSI